MLSKYGQFTRKFENIQEEANLIFSEKELLQS